MDRQRLRVARALLDDIERRRGGEDALRAADRLVRFYARAHERSDALVTVPRAQPPRQEPAVRKPARPKRRYKPVTADFVLAILQESGRPLSAREIGEQLAIRGREPLTRQAMSYVLLGLVREGKVERIETGSSPVRVLWQAH